MPEIKLPPEVEAAFEALEAGQAIDLVNAFVREDGTLSATIKIEPQSTFGVSRRDSGITSVLINLPGKSDYCARVGTHPGDRECFEVLDEEGNYRQRLYVHTGPLAAGIWADSKNKDQHVFYHIPRELLKVSK
jgi:hypothetical protein